MEFANNEETADDMVRLVKIALILVFLAFVAAQFIRPDQTNPPVDFAETIEASAPMPENVKQVLARSCIDCHSNTTAYPRYALISPISWYLNDHVLEGRQKLNFSIWNTYSPARKAKQLDEICEQVDTGAMPLPAYLWLHRDAILREGEARMLCDWAGQIKQTLPE